MGELEMGEKEENQSEGKQEIRGGKGQEIGIGGEREIGIGEGKLRYEEYIESAYQELTVLGGAEGWETTLVRHRMSGRIAVKKRVSAESARVYQAVRGMCHPNIVRVYEVCQGERDGIVVEEFISGETLGARLEEAPVSEEEAVRYGGQILDALQAIHKENIIHRDLTPENVLISADGVVKLIDFGIARSWKEGQAKDTTVLGTVGYASPEQFGFCQTDVTADFYAWGVLFNVMLTGKMPDVQLPEQERFRKIVQRCIQMEPTNRYESVERLRKDLWGRAVPRDLEKVKKEPFAMPGFRSGILWKKVVAIACYPMMILFTIDSVRMLYPNVMAMALEALAQFIYVWMLYLVATNFARWDRWVWPFSKISKNVNIAIRVTLCVFFFYYGTELEDFVKYTLAHLPRTGS